MNKIIKISDSKFKSIYFSYNFTLRLDKKEIADTVISCFALSKGCEKYNTSKDIEKYLSSLYGSSFDINVEKIGDLFNFEFKIECVNKKYLPNNEDVLLKCINFLNEIIYCPRLENGLFNTAIFEREKNYVINAIEKRKDEKLKYGVMRAEELMASNTSAGCFVYGNIEDAKKTSNEIAVKAYNKLISDSLITVILSGNLDGYSNLEKNIEDIFGNKLETKVDAEEIKKGINLPNIYPDGIQEVKEKMDTVQSVLCVGMKSSSNNEDDFFVANVYNSILGGSPSSKLFQNVREKESLAYTTRSRYYRFKKMFVIYAGIQEENYNKAKEVIFEQIEDMKNGNITEIEMTAAKESLISDLKEWKDSKIALEKYMYLNLFTDSNLAIEDMLQNISKVTLDDIVEYANNIETKVVYLLGGGNNE